MQDQIEAEWVALWLFLAAGLGINLVAWKREFFIPLGAGDNPGVGGGDVFRGFAAFFLVEIFLVPSVLSLIFSMHAGGLSDSLKENPQLKAWGNLLMIFGGFIAVCIAYRGLNRYTREALWGDIRKLWLHQLVLGIAAWFISYPIVMTFNTAISLLIGYFFSFPLVEQAAVQHVRVAMSTPLLLGITAISIVIFIPLTEEYLFRGLLQSWLKEKLHSPYLSIAITSLIFSFFHFSVDYGIMNIKLLSSLFLFSCVLGYLFERQRCLLAPVALHGFFNLISLLLMLYVN